MKRDRSKDPPKSAVELMAELRNDPEYQTRLREREYEYREAVKPLLDELATAGFRVLTEPFTLVN